MAISLVSHRETSPLHSYTSPASRAETTGPLASGVGNSAQKSTHAFILHGPGYRSPAWTEMQHKVILEFVFCGSFKTGFSSAGGPLDRQKSLCGVCVDGLGQGILGMQRSSPWGCQKDNDAASEQNQTPLTG